MITPADYYGILGLTSDATLADVKKAYRTLARQHHPDRNNADPGAIDRFRRITEAYEYLSAHLKDDPPGNGHSRPGPTRPPRADVGMPGGYSVAASRVLTMLEETWQAIRARHPEIPPVVIIIASGTTGRDARWDRFEYQSWTVRTISPPAFRVSASGWIFVTPAIAARRSSRRADHRRP